MFSRMFHFHQILFISTYLMVKMRCYMNRTPRHLCFWRHQLPKPILAFYLGNNQPGELLLRGVDPKHYTGDFAFVPLSSETYWQINLDAVKLSSDSMSSTKSAAALTTRPDPAAVWLAVHPRLDRH